jgi:peroxiredoxin-like protein
MASSHHYEVDLKWLSERKGMVQSPLLNNTIEVATPPEFAKGMPGIWSPEHLFVAAVSSCLMTTFLAVAENSKLEYISFDCNAVGTIEQVEGKYKVTHITLKPVLVIPPTQREDRAIRVVEMAEKHCMISNSVTSEIHLEPSIVVASE